MKLNILIASLAGAFISLSAQAGDFRDAGEICQTYDFSNFKQECVAVVRSFDNAYFDNAAVNVCKGYDFDNFKTECIRSIANKSYEYYEISNCQSLDFDNQKNACLKNSGRTYQRPQYGNGPGHGGHRPSPPPPPYQQPGYDNDYVRGNANSWERAGEVTVSKGISQKVSFNLNSRSAVAEIRLAASRADAKVLKATGITASGKLIQLSSLEGNIGKGNSMPLRLDPQYAIRLQKIELELVNTQLFGSRAHVEVMIGYTR